MVVPCRAQLQQSIWNLSSWRDTLMKDTFAFELSDNATTVSNRFKNSWLWAWCWAVGEHRKNLPYCAVPWILGAAFQIDSWRPSWRIFHVFLWDFRPRGMCEYLHVAGRGWWMAQHHSYISLASTPVLQHVWTCFFTSNSCRWGLKQPASTVPKCNANGSLPSWSVLGHDMTC